jgi:hypothetical protein
MGWPIGKLPDLPGKPIRSREPFEQIIATLGYGR